MSGNGGLAAGVVCAKAFTDKPNSIVVITRRRVMAAILYFDIGFNAGATPAGSGVRPTLSAIEMSE
jgi:hypothetical protein